MYRFPARSITESNLWLDISPQTAQFLTTTCQLLILVEAPVLIGDSEFSIPAFLGPWCVSFVAVFFFLFKN